MNRKDEAFWTAMEIAAFIALLIGVVVALSGCSNPSYCQAHTEAERAIVAYQDDFGGTVTPVQAACVHQFNLDYPGKHDVEATCGDNTVGCALIPPPPMHPTMIEVRRFVPGRDTKLGVLRHELTHLVLYCATGDGHPAHDVPEFNFHDGPTDEPGTLMWWMARTEVAYDCGAP